MMSVFVILGLLVCTEAQGSSAVTPVFVQRGEDVLLNIMKADSLDQFILFSWKFNGKDFLVTADPDNNPTAFPNCTARIEFSLENDSMKGPDGSSAETHVFVKKGEDVLLKIMKADGLEKFNFLTWKFNASNVLVVFTPNNDPVVDPNYTGRIEFSVENYSVKLKNLQKTDSGVYTARVLRIPTNLKVAEYKVTVQDPMSPVDLTVDSVSRSSNSCNVTVTCRTQDSHINSTFRCDTQTCSQEGGEQSKVTTSGASLQVYLDRNGAIICNHSNQVSWTENKEIIEHLCPRHADSECLSPGISVCLVKTVVFSVGLIIMVSAVITVHLMDKLKKKK